MANIPVLGKLTHMWYCILEIFVCVAEIFNEFFFLYQLLIDCVGINMAYLKLVVGKLSNTVTLMELVLLSLNSKCKGTFDTKF